MGSLSGQTMSRQVAGARVCRLVCCLPLFLLSSSPTPPTLCSCGRWHVPSEPRAARRRFAQQTVQQLQALFRGPPGKAAGSSSSQRRAAVAAAVLTSVTGLAAMGALLLAQLQAAHWGGPR